MENKAHEQVLQLLITGGFLDPDKLQEARDIIGSCPSPLPDESNVGFTRADVSCDPPLPSIDIVDNALPGSQEKDIFNDKTIGKTIRDLPEKYSWQDIFEIGVGIPTGTKHFLSTYFKIPERAQSTIPNKIEESGLKEGEEK